MSKHAFPPGYSPRDPGMVRTAAELDANQASASADACRVSFLGIADGGLRVNLAYGDGLGRIIRFIHQSRLADRTVQEELFGREWLRKHFPKYLTVDHRDEKDAASTCTVVTDDFDPLWVYRWAVAKCFEAAGYPWPACR